MRFQVSVERCESFVRMDVRGVLLFQIAGAAERKPQALNEMLQQVGLTERKLADADRRVLHGVCHWTRLARYGGLYPYVLVYGS